MPLTTSCKTNKRWPYQSVVFVYSGDSQEGARNNIPLRHIQHFENAHSYDVAVPIPLEDLIPDDPTAFFTYDGSLTTPECNEAVIWMVFQTPIAVCQRQV
jgi:carbonic anhydrase